MKKRFKPSVETLPKIIAPSTVAAPMDDPSEGYPIIIAPVPPPNPAGPMPCVIVVNIKR